MNILVVEDNEITRKNLVKTIHKNFEQCIVYEASMGKQAIALLQSHHIDLFFLDIELPDINGMEIAKKIRSIEKYEFTNIVFITTHITLLPKALQEYHCYDFIEKPFKMDKIVQTVNQLIKGISKEQQQEKKKYITITSGNVSNKIHIKDLIYMEIQGRRQVFFHTKGGVYQEKNTSLKKIMEQMEKLEVSNFVRSHKAYIVNINLIYQIEHGTRTSGNIFFKDYEGIALLGETYKEELIKKFEME